MGAGRAGPRKREPGGRTSWGASREPQRGRRESRRGRRDGMCPRRKVPRAKLVRSGKCHRWTVVRARENDQKRQEREKPQLCAPQSSTHLGEPPRSPWEWAEEAQGTDHGGGGGSGGSEGSSLWRTQGHTRALRHCGLPNSFILAHCSS